MSSIPIVDNADKRKGIIASVIVMLLVFLLVRFIYFEEPDPPLRDIPLATETTIEEIELKELRVEGGTGGGTPKDAPVSEPKPQTQKTINTPKPKDTQVPTGESNTTNDVNHSNTSSTTTPSNNPFGDGGKDGGKGGGEGGDIGKDSGVGNGGESGDAIGGKGRIRLNDVSVDGIEINVDATIHYKLSVDAQGNVVSVLNIKNKTTTTDSSLINKIAYAIRKQVKFNKAPGSPIVKQFYTVHVKAA